MLARCATRMGKSSPLIYAVFLQFTGLTCGSNVWSEGGNIVGRAELVPESERAGQKEGPFAGFEGAKVTKDGLVADASGVTIGRLIEGDGKKLYGKEVDSDGDVSSLKVFPLLQ